MFRRKFTVRLRTLSQSCLIGIIALSLLIFCVVSFLSSSPFRAPEPEEAGFPGLLHRRKPSDEKMRLIKEHDEQVPFKIIDSPSEQEADSLESSSSGWIIRDVVRINEKELVAVVANVEDRFAKFEDELFNSDMSSCFASIFGREDLEPARVISIDSVDGNLGMIRCALTTSSTNKVEKLHLELRSRNMSSTAILASNSAVLNSNNLIFEAVVTPEEVVLLSKGIVSKKQTSDGKDKWASSVKCVYEIDSDATSNSRRSVDTRLIGLAQEIFRCEHPPQHFRQKSPRISIRFTSNSRPADSVAIYNPPRSLESPDQDPPSSTAREGHVDKSERERASRRDPRVCACTMLRDAAKFLPEWLAYHSHIGIEKFFLYDNNSEDELKEYLVEAKENYTVVRRPWPWPKAQEAGFSHCAAASKDECDWVAFIDVDEFLYPHELLNATAETEGAKSSIVARTINSAGSKHRDHDKLAIGQILFHCHDFGPNGLTDHPPEGVTQGYTCRQKRSLRHKSLVRLEAIENGLVNVIHHFNLDKRHYRTVKMPENKAVVNHYKYQAWSEFKNKFRSRVSAYVSDWSEDKNLHSQDRVPGLETSAKKPLDWETRFCDVFDTGLHDYVQEIFGDPPPWKETY